jgi:uncharacterized membrane protein
LLIPPFAILFGAVFLGEKIEIDVCVGFAIICLGFAVTDGRLFSSLFRKASN